MKNSRPECATCKSNEFVKTKGGGTFGKYRYQCMSCNTTWQQIAHTSINKSPSQSILTQKTSSRNIYKCKKCGNFKKDSCVCNSKGTKQPQHEDMYLYQLPMYTLASTDDPIVEAPKILFQ